MLYTPSINESTGKYNPQDETLELLPEEGSSYSYEQLLELTTAEIRRARVNNNQGKAYLLELFGKENRQYLNNTELVKFLEFLKKLPDFRGVHRGPTEIPEVIEDLCDEEELPPDTKATKPEPLDFTKPSKFQTPAVDTEASPYDYRYPSPKVEDLEAFHKFLRDGLGRPSTWNKVFKADKKKTVVHFKWDIQTILNYQAQGCSIYDVVNVLPADYEPTFNPKKWNSHKGEYGAWEYPKGVDIIQRDCVILDMDDEASKGTKFNADDEERLQRLLKAAPPNVGIYSSPPSEEHPYGKRQLRYILDVTGLTFEEQNKHVNHLNEVLCRNLKGDHAIVTDKVRVMRTPYSVNASKKAVVTLLSELHTRKLTYEGLLATLESLGFDTTEVPTKAPRTRTKKGKTVPTRSTERKFTTEEFTLLNYALKDYGVNYIEKVGKLGGHDAARNLAYNFYDIYAQAGWPTDSEYNGDFQAELEPVLEHCLVFGGRADTADDEDHTYRVLGSAATAWLDNVPRENEPDEVEPITRGEELPDELILAKLQEMPLDFKNEKRNQYVAFSTGDSLGFKDPLDAALSVVKKLNWLTGNMLEQVTRLCSTSPLFQPEWLDCLPVVAELCASNTMYTPGEKTEGEGTREQRSLKEAIKNMHELKSPWEQVTERIRIEQVYKVTTANLNRYEVAYIEEQKRLKKTVLLDLEELRNSDIPECSWVVEGLVPSTGVITLNADAKSGKTLFAYSLIEAVASGGTFLKWKCKPQNVVLIQCDEDRKEFVPRLRKLKLTEEEMSRVKVIEDWQLDEKGLEDLEEEVLKKYAPCVIIGDSLVRLTLDTNEKMKEATYTNKINALDKLVARYNSVVILLNHLTKLQRDISGIDNRGFEAILGSGQILGVGGGGLMLKRKGKQCLLTNRLRNASDKGYLINLTFNEDKSWSFSDCKEVGADYQIVVDDSTQRVLSKLDDGVRLKGGDLIKALGMDPRKNKSQYKVFERMVKEGFLDYNDSDKTYGLAEAKDDRGDLNSYEYFEEDTEF